MCSHSLLIFPWEILLKENVVRYFSLQDFVTLQAKRKEIRDSTKVTIQSGI
jgi:hypothetical protein